MGNRHKGLGHRCPGLSYLGRFAVEISLNRRRVQLGPKATSKG